MDSMDAALFQPPPPLYNPPGETRLDKWFLVIGEASQNVDNWNKYLRAIVQATAADCVYLLKRVRQPDMLEARLSAMVNSGYEIALCRYLSPEGATVLFAFPSVDEQQQTVMTEPVIRLTAKKYGSQQARTTLSRELGVTATKALTFPPGIFQYIKHSSGLPMKAKGKHGTSKVADAIVRWILTLTLTLTLTVTLTLTLTLTLTPLRWVIAKYGTIHVDAEFCERMEELLLEMWPILQPWKGKTRSWKDIIINRFSNMRQAEKVWASCTHTHTHA